MRRLGMLILTGVAATSSLAAAPAASVEGAADEEVAPGGSTHAVVHDGITRTYRRYVPPSLPEGRAPVVVVLHGGYGRGEGVARQGGWDAAADRYHFVAVFPDGLLRSWNAGGCCGPAMRNDIDDVGFVGAVLDDLASDVPVARRRVYATGISNGGMMAYRLACEASDRFAAVAPVAATLMATDCTPTEPVSLLHIHGLADANVPFDGGLPSKHAQRNPPDYPPVRDGVDIFVHADDCDAHPRSEPDGPLTVERWTGCVEKTAVELTTIEGGGHSWPGGQRIASILDPPSEALDATTVIWRFFATHPRAA